METVAKETAKQQDRGSRREKLLIAVILAVVACAGLLTFYFVHKHQSIQRGRKELVLVEFFFGRIPDNALECTLHLDTSRDGSDGDLGILTAAGWEHRKKFWMQRPPPDEFRILPSMKWEGHLLGESGVATWTQEQIRDHSRARAFFDDYVPYSLIQFTPNQIATHKPIPSGFSVAIVWNWQDKRRSNVFLASQSRMSLVPGYDANEFTPWYIPAEISREEYDHLLKIGFEQLKMEPGFYFGGDTGYGLDVEYADANGVRHAFLDLTPHSKNVLSEFQNALNENARNAIQVMQRHLEWEIAEKKNRNP